ncbi:carboxypeptidase regulatory-like domain-containing protein [Cellvibrio fibrivorans]|uniref:Uncharacterized protein n=1 Tax=Cellvibrio fibrivorans TaxID=126350 RepID=A0ABU1UTY3_9GAMM|nr:carboxypeptidase regulatory-like domain-containing protein [Cellvibrio fibrivorans]MDR7088632.1 hypothetical protein [Cellvibrio fibrivorans]
MGSLFVFRKMLPAFFFLIIVQISSLAVASVDSGVAWLKSQQRADGGFDGIASQATENQGTVEALLAIHQFSNLDNAVAHSGSEYLRSVSSSHLEDVASFQRLAKINPLHFPAPTLQLTAYEASSGGYGDYPGYEGAVSTSAILAHALTAPDAQPSVNRNELIAYLLAKQKADKGWAEESNRSSVYVTALVSRALQTHRFTFNLSASIASATEYLLANQQAGGGWSGNLETVVALLAVVPAVTDPSRYKIALDKLTDAQLSNGSWNNDVYTTALALQVLHLVKNPPVFDEPTSGSVSGSVISASSNLPLASAQIILDGPTSQTLITDGMGRFNASNVTSGTYVLKYKSLGFQDATQTVQINVGDRIELGTIKLNLSPTSALIRGHVTDSETGLSLNGVAIQFTGSENSQVVTDQAGNYSFALAPGEVSISISQSGYHPISGTLNAVAGVHLDFSPALQTLDSTPNAGIALRGLVVDAQSNAPLSGASIRITSTAISGMSSSDGSFSLSGLTEGAINVEISLGGYQKVSFTGTALTNSIFDLGTVHLTPEALDHSMLYGRIVDADTGTPIANATVTADSQTTNSSIDGAYELKNIQASVFALSASAEGYQLANAQIRITGYGMVLLDIPLQKIKVSNVALKQLSLDKPTYGAYETVKLTGAIHNRGVEAEEVVIQAQVINPLGITIEEFVLSHDATAGLQVLPLAPDEETGFTSSWATQSYSPGQYKILLTAYNNSTRQLLDQQQLILGIQPTASIASFKLGATLDNLNQGSTHDVGFTASVRNQSNIPISLQVMYDLSDPAGNVIFSTDADIEVAPTQLFATFDIGALNQLFGNGGAYKLRVLNIDSLQPALIETGAINVIPDININIEQAITPSVVVPGASERVRVKIRLEGTEVN